jgi:hypothetical protein
VQKPNSIERRCIALAKALYRDSKREKIAAAE